MKILYILLWVSVGISVATAGNKLIDLYIVPEYVNTAVDNSDIAISSLISRESSSRYTLPIVVQESVAFCGVASIVNVMASYGINAPSQNDILKNDLSPLDYWNVFLTGITLDELSVLIISQGDYKTEIVRPTTINQMKTALAQLDEPNTRIIANFSRMPLFGENIGHHTPVGAYDKQSGTILLFDVTAGYGNYSVKEEAMFVALQTLDSETGRQRGLLIIRKNWI